MSEILPFLAAHNAFVDTFRSMLSDKLLGWGMKEIFHPFLKRRLENSSFVSAKQEEEEIGPWNERRPHDLKVELQLSLKISEKNF